MQRFVTDDLYKDLLNGVTVFLMVKKQTEVSMTPSVETVKHRELTYNW